MESQIDGFLIRTTNHLQVGGQRSPGLRGPALQPAEPALARPLPGPHVHLQRLLLHRPQLGGAAGAAQEDAGEVREGHHSQVGLFYATLPAG